jgi:hypothetical protein
MRRTRTMVIGLLMLAAPAAALLWFAVPGRAALQAATPPPLPMPTLGRPGGGPLPVYEYSVAPGVLESAHMYIPDQVMVYRLLRRTPTKADVREAVARIGITIADERYAVLPERADPEFMYSASVDGIDVDVEEDGAYQFNMRDQHPDSRWPEAPSDEEAKHIADKFLSRTRISLEECGFTAVSVGEAVGFTPPGEDRSVQLVIGKLVRYDHYRNGISDGSIALRVNGKGGVYQLSVHIPRVKRLASYPILSPEEAIAALGGGPRSVVVGPGGAVPRHRRVVKAVIDRIELRYYAGWREETLQPTYSISGSVPGYADRFSGTVLAVRPEFLMAPALGRPGG